MDTRMTAPQNPETAAREALDSALTQIAEELLHRASGGKPRMVAFTTDELRALSARPSAPEALRAALTHAAEAMESVTVFVTTRERIKRPEGEQWWKEQIAAAYDAQTE